MTNEQIRIAWDEAEEIHSSLDELTDEEIIECKVALKDSMNFDGALEHICDDIDDDDVEETENE